VVGPFKQRSSWPSSIATGLIGWIGVSSIVSLAVGHAGHLMEIVFMALLAALVQVVFLRLAFTRLRMERGIAAGALWGGISAAVIAAGGIAMFPLLQEHPAIALVTGLYAGIPVGAFLSYFHADDRRIEAEAMAAGELVDYGRDAHWLDPFVYGALSYEVALFPRASDAVIAAAVVGMIVGVVAAGVSHFILSRWQNMTGTVPAATIAGVALGIVTGFLFRQYAPQLLFPPLVSGGIAGGLTFLVTAVVGRRLARREREAGGQEDLA
jgi:hypothetical protein